MSEGVAMEQTEAPLTFNDVIPGLQTPAPVTDSALGLGKRRTIADVEWKEWVFVVVSGVSLIITLILTIYKLAASEFDGTDQTLAIVIIICVVFCCLYLIEGVLQERAYEIAVLVISTIFVLVYIISNYATSKHKTTEKLIRLIAAALLTPAMILLGAWIAKTYFDSGKLIFRMVGANGQLQDACKNLFFFQALLKFDIQTSLCVVILIIEKLSAPNTLDIIVLGVGIPYMFLATILGYMATRLESKPLSILFVVIAPLQVAYVVYKIVKICEQGDLDKNGLAIPSLVCSIFAIAIHVAVYILLVKVWKNYGIGLKGKIYGKQDGDENVASQNTYGSTTAA